MIFVLQTNIFLTHLTLKMSFMLMYSIANIHGLGVRLSCFLFLSVYFNTLLIIEDEELCGLAFMKFICSRFSLALFLM